MCFSALRMNFRLMWYVSSTRFRLFGNFLPAHWSPYACVTIGPSFFCDDCWWSCISGRWKMFLRSAIYNHNRLSDSDFHFFAESTIRIEASKRAKFADVSDIFCTQMLRYLHSYTRSLFMTVSFQLLYETCGRFPIILSSTCPVDLMFLLWAVKIAACWVGYSGFLPSMLEMISISVGYLSWIALMMMVEWACQTMDS